MDIFCYISPIIYSNIQMKGGDTFCFFLLPFPLILFSPLFPNSQTWCKSTRLQGLIYFGPRIGALNFVDHRTLDRLPFGIWLEIYFLSCISCNWFELVLSLFKLLFLSQISLSVKHLSCKTFINLDIYFSGHHENIAWGVLGGDTSVVCLVPSWGCVK